ncbi:nucleotidyltransferase domain-containing protein [Haladaptatus sp. F3-133]|uniref:Nucleotidyltransferase domain-containing protein n=1 Tax=Halorutilus salinus TaxID=2487751 RepID=A0A9Q4GH59_9EURY|nr:nucleotidyltransferase domain-containing protein [Halorutilus salinus]MCX2819487.1 nucleotidyltransferase domain-containing protein [Halorutilus salinus]
MIDQNLAGVTLPIPLGEERVFRNQAMEDITELLYRNPHEEFGVRQLREVTGHGAQTVDTAIKLLEQVNLIQTRRERNQKLISINRNRIHKPDDPILEIPQEGFRTPVKTFVDRVEEDQGDNLVGILLFGSVARGEGDRASDIDIQVIVEEDLLESRRSIQDIRQEIEEQKFDGNRYELQVLVESVETAEDYGDKLQEIFSEAITLYGAHELDKLRKVILNG